MPLTTLASARTPRSRKRGRAKTTRPSRSSLDPLTLESKSCWERWSPTIISKAFDFAAPYSSFISTCKTERLVTEFVRREAEAAGYHSLDEAEQHGLGSGQGRINKIYAVNRHKNIILARLGNRPLSEGVRFVLTHIDSPRLDLKVRPLYEDAGLAFFKTHYYGGIKKYQWPTNPLALYGVVVKKDGTRVHIAIGDQPNDPVFAISDLLPHLGKKQMEKPLGDAIQAEELNLIIGSQPDRSSPNEKQKIKMNILKLLNAAYGITEADFVSADLEIVPAGNARDVGFDRSLILAYGHDDRVCTYASLRAHLDATRVTHASLAVFVDKEEIGSTSNTGATSNFFFDTMGRLAALEADLPRRSEHDSITRGILEKSQALSGDVTAAFDPDYRDVFDPLNSAHIGHGVAVEKHTGSRGKSFTSEANAEYMAIIRSTLDNAGVPWQTGGLGKVDVGGGGTIAMFLAEHNMDIVDCGPAVLSMHAPYEIISKADLYATYLAYAAFITS